MNTVKPVLHFICGKIASGKTTLARKIANDTGAIFICEDEWLSKLYADDIKSFEDYIKYTNRMKTLLYSHVGQLLKKNISVVFDFAGNTPNHRKWVRSVFEFAEANHKLYVLDVSDAECKKRLAQRNVDKPEGLYWGVSPTEADYDLITKYFSKPSVEEGFNLENVE